MLETTTVRTTILCFFLLILICCNQQAYYLLDVINEKERSEISAHGTLMARKVLQEDCRKDPNPKKFGSLTGRKQFGIYQVEGMTVVPISLFKISSKGRDYNGLALTKYLEWSKNDLIGFYTFKDGAFEGLLDWSGEHHYNLSTECAYFNIRNDNKIRYETYWLGYNFLKENGRDTSFLFGVKYFLETLWFIENEKAFILDLQEMKIYDPDEFVLNKCDAGFVRSVADGGQIICNY